MEEIRNILIEIATILNKQQRYLKNDEFLSLTSKIQTASYSELSKYACEFLHMAVFLRNSMSFPKRVMDLFKEINDYFIMSAGSDDFKIYSNMESIRRYFKERDFITFFDAHFDASNITSISLTRKAMMFIPIEDMIPTVEELYRQGAYTEERTSDISFQGQTLCATLAYDRGLLIELNSYQVDNNSLNICYYDEQKRKVKKLELPLKATKVLVKDGSGNIRFLVPELTYLAALHSGTSLDFIELMEIKDKVKPRKIRIIEKLIEGSQPVERKEVKYGLQKTS